LEIDPFTTEGLYKETDLIATFCNGSNSSKRKWRSF